MSVVVVGPKYFYGLVQPEVAASVKDTVDSILKQSPRSRPLASKNVKVPHANNKKATTQFSSFVSQNVDPPAAIETIIEVLKGAGFQE